MKINKLTNFAIEVRSEVYKISWPIAKDTMISSLLVLIVLTISSLFFLMVDGAIYKSINYMLTLGRGE